MVPVLPNKTMNRTNSSLKIGMPEIRVPLASKPAKSNMIVRTAQQPTQKMNLIKPKKRK